MLGIKEINGNKTEVGAEIIMDFTSGCSKNNINIGYMIPLTIIIKGGSAYGYTRKS
jgi:hypothetical protein